MQPGQISDPVKTQFGYHIIRLDEIRPAHVLSLADGRAKIEADYRRDAGSRDVRRPRGAAAAEARAAAEHRSGGSGQRIRHADWARLPDFTRAGGGAPLGSKPELAQAVFSDETLAGDKIGGPVALADDRVVLFKVLGSPRARAAADGERAR